MSGIMAIVSLDGRPVPPELARAQLAAIAHRGECGPRLWEGPGVALGHVNLPRTPEAEREVLPMADRSGRYRLTWDGRLDNRDELGPKLGYDAAERAGKTDAEYVLDSFLKWGDDCVHQLVGDWAVVIWDNEARWLFCAKDPVGYRQLFFREHEGYLLVGSEPQQLFAGGAGPMEPDREYTLRYLAGVMQEPGRTWLAGMSHLAGGERMVATEAGVRAAAYWTQPRITPRTYRRPEEYVDEFEAVFARAVADRLRTNRPVGVYLSGGIDSSYVAAVITRQGHQATALTSYAPGTSRMDERKYAQLVVAHLGMRQVETDISDCWTLSRAWVPDAYFDNPFHPPQAANQARMGLIARREGIGVILGGEGGDEWCNGPENYIGNTLARGKFVTAWKLSRKNRGRKRSARRLAAELRDLSLEPIRRRHWDTGPEGDALIDGVDVMKHMRTPSAWSHARFQRIEWDIQRQIGWLEPSWRDRHEAAPNGVERRPPFFDLRVIEMLASTPPWMKRFNGRRKDILREAETRVLPKVIADRTDWGLYDELYFRGLRSEPARTSLGLAMTDQFVGRPSPAAVRESLATAMPPVDHAAWRTVSTGLWLDSMGFSGTARPEANVAGSAPTGQARALHPSAERR